MSSVFLNHAATAATSKPGPHIPLQSGKSENIIKVGKDESDGRCYKGEPGENMGLEEAQRLVR